MTIGPDIDPRRAGALPFVIAWLVLLLLAAVSLGLAFLPVGVWTPVGQFAIAFVQTAIVFSVFMRLKGPPTLKWIFAVAGFVWLSFLFGLSMTDYSNRRGWPMVYSTTEPNLNTK